MNGDVFAFDSDVNKRFQHGVPKLTGQAATIRGPRFSIIAWGRRRSLNERNGGGSGLPSRPNIVLEKKVKVGGSDAGSGYDNKNKKGGQGPKQGQGNDNGEDDGPDLTLGAKKYGENKNSFQYEDDVKTNDASSPTPIDLQNSGGDASLYKSSVEIIDAEELKRQESDKGVPTIQSVVTMVEDYVKRELENKSKVSEAAKIKQEALLKHAANMEAAARGIGNLNLNVNTTSSTGGITAPRPTATPTGGSPLATSGSQTPPLTAPLTAASLPISRTQRGGLVGRGGVIGRGGGIGGRGGAVVPRGSYGGLGGVHQ